MSERASSPWVEVIERRSRLPVLLLCDHAGHAVPDAVGPLGIDDVDLQRHIGWDIGAAAITRALATRLGAAAILNHVSRLVIDANRRPFGPGSIPPVSDGCSIPANRGLSPDAARGRVRDYFLPYHRAIARWIALCRRNGEVPLLIAIHSFTPRLDGEERPWQVGVLWRGDRRVAGAVLDALHLRPGLVVGDNRPYSGLEAFGFTVTFHAQRTRLPHLMLELRQDEIATDEGAARYAGLLGEVLAPILADETLYRLFEGDNLPATERPCGWRGAAVIPSPRHPAEAP